MVTTADALKIFVNAIRQNVEDVIQKDADDYYYSFRASKSYWVDQGWFSERLQNYGLPQISIFHVGGRKVAEGKKSNSERYIGDTFQVDIFASGRPQKQDLTNQVMKGLFTFTNRLSTNRSGLKIDSLLTDYDTIEDEILPQEIFRKQMSFRVFYQTSGA